MRTRLGTALAVTPLLVLAACGGGGGHSDDSRTDDATKAATNLAEGLASGDLSGVTFTRGTSSGVTTDYAAVVKGMGDLKPTVSVGDVAVSADGATATLHWSWPLAAGHPWAYDTRVPLASPTTSGGTWTVGWGHSVVEPQLNAASVLDATTIEADRGLVVGAGGTPLVTQRSVVHVGIDRTKVPAAKVAASARTLATLVGIDVAPYVKEVMASGPKAFVEAITYRLGQVPEAVNTAGSHVPGVALLNAHEPLAPTKEFAAPILGSVGPVTAEMIKDHPGVYSVGDEAGLSGLQERYDSTLQGTPGVVVDALGSDGQRHELERVPAKRGTTLHLTLDRALETKAESLLAHVGPASAIVAVKPSTGAVLVAANGPGNDGQDLATYGRYAPGSTFKTASTLALLRSGETPRTVVPCTTSLDVDGRVFTNDSDYPPGAIGRIPLSEALANSCNTAYISQRHHTTQKALVAAAASLGMGVDHEVGFPAYFGSVEPGTTETGAAANMIGQGTVLASPMTMATVIATIENGSVVVPHLVDGVPGLDTKAPSGITPLTAHEDAELKSMLRGVVTSGTGAGLRDVPGPPVIAKTGTAEFDAPDGSTKTHAWMIAAQGDLAVAVFVDVGHTGAGTAGPILEAFLRAARSGR